MVLQAPAGLASLRLPAPPPNPHQPISANSLSSWEGGSSIWARAESQRPTQGKDFSRVAGAARVYTGRLSWRARAGAEGDRWPCQNVGYGCELLGQSRELGAPLALSYLGPVGRLKLGLS